MIGKLVRSIRLATVLAIGVTLLAVPAASADEGFVLPAGEACSFDVLLEDVTRFHAEAADFHNPIGSGEIKLTNLDTGATYLQVSRHQARETFDPDTNTVLVQDKGTILTIFFPEDQGPNGVVGEPGALLAFSGTRQYTLDLDTDIFLAFSYTGSYRDLCAELSD